MEPRFAELQVAGIMAFLASGRSARVALRRFSYRKVREVPEQGPCVQGPIRDRNAAAERRTR